MTRIAITGVGMISPAGLGAQAGFDAVVEGRDLLGLPSQTGLFRIEQPVAEVRGYDAEAHFDHRRLVTMDRVSQFAVVAAREAVAQSGFDPRTLPDGATCCFVGTGVGGETSRDESSQRVYTGLTDRVHPLTVPRVMVSACASQVAMDLGIRGGVMSVSSACASGAHAIGQAVSEIRAGRVRVAIAGGAEACLSYGCLTAWKALHVMSEDRCRPFSLGRRGLILAEGAAMLVLEDHAHAIARGAIILGEVSGFGMTSDAASLTAPAVEGMARAIRLALQDAGWSGNDVDHINTHGTGTYANDVAESQAIVEILGPRGRDVPIAATKSVLGHAFGASPAMELVIATTTLATGTIPPIANFVASDEACPMNCVVDVPMQSTPRRVLSNSFAFGGLNAVVALQHASLGDWSSVDTAVSIGWSA